MGVELALIGIAWLAIALMLAWGVMACMYRLFATPAPLPFFARLESLGLTALQLESAVGVGEVARAVRRCALCAGRRDCARGRTVDCPNLELLQKREPL
jgi:hypothetical protein